MSHTLVLLVLSVEKDRNLKLFLYLSSITLPSETQEVLLVCVSWINN